MQKRILIAFSLIELMISLIAISVITAAFTPVISKKIKSGEIAINSSVSVNCSGQFGAYCLACDLSKNPPICLACVAPCAEGESADITTCQCASCKTKFNNQCLTCSSVQCKRCQEGYYIDDDGKCTICHKGYYCNGTNKTQCSNNQYQNLQVNHLVNLAQRVQHPMPVHQNVIV